MMRVKLGDVCERGSSSIRQSDVEGVEGEYPIYGAAGLIGNVGFFHQAKPYVAVVKDGAGIGKTMLLPSKSSVIGTLQYLLPKENILPEYLYYVVQHMHLEKYFSGSTIPHIYFRDYQNEMFNLDAPETQAKTVRVLRSVERIIACQQNELSKLDELVKARFVEMFGDPWTNPHKWEKHQLEEYMLFQTSGSRGWSRFFSESGAYFITIKNVKNCKITLDGVQYILPPDNAEAKRTRVQEGDLLISITADLGRTGVITKEIADHGAYINQHLSCIRLDRKKLDPLFTAYYLESDAGKQQFESKNQSGVKAGLNFNSINSLKLFVPPLQYQAQFTAFATQVEKSKAAVQSALDKAQMLFDSLMQKYFG